MTVYGTAMTDSDRPAVFTWPFIILVACLWAMAGAVFAFATEGFPIINGAVGAGLVGLGLGILLRLFDRWRY